MEECTYCRLLEKLLDASVYYQIPVDKSGRPHGLIFLDCSPAFEKMVGVRKSDLVCGNLIKGLPAGLLRFGFDWFGTYARLAKSDELLKFEHYDVFLNCWYEVSVCRNEQNCFAAIFRDISGRKQIEKDQVGYLDQLTALLDNIPHCYAMILKKYSREIVISNRAAQETGAFPGKYCFKTFGERDDCCPFCRAPKLWASSQVQHVEIKHRGRWYEGVWMPLSNELYAHYFIDINKYKLAAQKTAVYSLKLEQLYFRLEKEMEKVKEMHKRTFPSKIPEIKGCFLAAYYQPARRFGGDFYDIIENEHKLILYLSDVSGHGPEGALLSAFVKEAINSYISLKPEKIHPEKILCHLYRRYRQENYPEDYFICIFLAVLDLLTMELSYIGAGFHAFPLVQMGKGGRRLQLISKGLPISRAVPATLMNYTAKQITLLPGTTIFFYTDGLTEQEMGGINYGSRLPDVFFKKSHLPPEAIIQAVKEDFQGFNGGRPLGNDDITLVVLQLEQ